VTVAVVTGGSAGVGRAVVAELAGRGIDVAVLARGRAGLEGAGDDARSLGVRSLSLAVDVADADAVEAAADRVEAELGPIDLWINNAMTTVFAPLVEVTADEFRRATEVTYLGQVHGTMAALRRMRPRNRGHIVNVGSALAYRGIPLQSAYCGAKFACRGFTESVRTELLHERSAVRISMVHLPAVNTPQFSWCLNRLPYHPKPVPPVYRPQEAAASIVRVALDGRRQKVLGTFNSFIVWANKLAPGVVDHYVARTGVPSQQASFLADAHRRVDLWTPVDDAEGGDHGASGIFGRSAHGVLDGSFVRSLPQTGLSAARASLDRVVEVIRDHGVRS
jgi:NAD(P)-dependent dehydrogenase (short-subunit alcohol dehydrogenase family)